MRTIRFVSFLGFAAAVLAFANAHAAQPIPAEAFGAVPQVDGVELSPNGTLLAWYDERAARASVVIYDIAAQKYRKTMPIAKNAKFRSLGWADDETLLVTLSTAFLFDPMDPASKFEKSRTYATDVSGGQERMLLMKGGDREYATAAKILALRTHKPKTVIMTTVDYSANAAQDETGSRLGSSRRDSGWVSNVYEVDIRTGEGKRLERGTAFTDNWLVDKDGNVVARSEWNPKSEIFTILAKKGSGWIEILREAAKGTRAMYGLTRDGTAILLSDTNKDDRETLSALPLDGSGSKPFLEDSTYDVSNVIHDRYTRLPVGVWLGGAEQNIRWIEPDAEKQFRRVAGAFPGKTVSLYGRSENNQLVLAAVEGPSSPRVYYLVDLAAGKAGIVGEEYPALANITLGEKRAITYKARDGAMVPAYLTLPPGSSGKGLPLVLLPHGGPESRDEYTFNWWAQFLAARGYAVLQPQFRGSIGFGETWRKAGYRQWGRLMQDDLTDGVKALIEQGVADARRVCIVGASYGGYAALAGAAFTPELFRCAVSVGGVSDLSRMLSYEGQHTGTDSNAVAYWRDHIGRANDPEVIAKSPANAAGQVTIPVLLIHSTDDTVVPISQSELMARNLSAKGKNVTLIKVAGEDHWLSNSETRIQVLKEIDKFLAANL